MLYSTTGEKYVVTMRNLWVPLPLGEGRHDSRKAGAPGEGRKFSPILKPHSPSPRGGRMILPVVDPNPTTQTKSLGTCRA